MYPVSVRVLGTGVSTPVIPDTFQNPFNIGIGVVAAAATYSVQHCFDYTTVMSPLWNGTGSVTWFDNSGITATALATCNGNYAFPVAAIRLNVTGAVATSVVTMMLIQAQDAP